ncbi:Holliday junction recognition protein [Ictidomys tridecemlineatus]|uniref:Holliday junction recognition protein isoform X1 n=1 Tax=Ictidomys tridecemlineatus TaxID=43179 RepID=UPI000B53B54B|nr:Holliday junction recognition protein isoform X1 [Ictidomys tridecemlineatus]KAG3275582.1 Holliday junction recognition protein [Ictidomys tridecemlineatus]
MEGRGLEEDALLQKLRDSRRRFQRRMRELIEKYDQPFEDDPLVQMATLTYQTPQGLKIWGGKLIAEGSEGLIQYPPGKPEDRMEDPGYAAARGDEPVPLCPLVLRADPGGSDARAAVDLGSPLAQALVPSVPWSPLKNELRRKYLTQVDALLQDAGCFEGTDKRGTSDTPMTPVPSLASPAMPGPGPCGSVSAESPGDPMELTPSPRELDPLRPCPADLATASRNDSLSLLGTSSCVSSQSFEADDICDVTISDLYAGMLHSMSRLLSTKPSSIICTKTFIVQSRSSRRRHVRRGRVLVSERHCARARCSRRGSRERPAPCSEPRQETGPLRDCKNLLHVAQHEPSSKLDRAFLAGNKAQSLKLDPRWKELQVTPWKHSSLTWDLNTVHHPDQENRVRMLKWLISPVKIVSGPKMLPSPAENRYREIEIKFNKLHQECCPSVGKGASPGGLGGLKTLRRSLPFSKAKRKGLSEAFENLSKRCVEVGRGPPESDASPSLPKSRGHSWQTSGLLQGHSSGTFRKAWSPRQAISVPRVEPLACERNRYNEIKENFDQLHQEYCQRSPRQQALQAKAPAPLGVSPDKADVGVQSQTPELFGKSNRDSVFQKLSPSPQWHMRSPQGSPAAETHPSAHSAHGSRRDPQSPAKRHRLSDPQARGHRASFQDSSEVDEADPRPGEQAGPPQASW